MVTIDYGGIQEADEGLILSPFVEHTEALGTLSLAADRLVFTGGASAKISGLFTLGGTGDFDRIIAIARLITNGGADLTSFGILFPSIMVGIAIANVNADNTDKLYFYDHRTAGFTGSALASDAEYTTTIGLLKLQIDVNRRVDDKGLPTIQFLTTYAWNGVIKQTRIVKNIGRGRLLPYVIPFIKTDQATATIAIDRVSVIMDKRVPNLIGEAEPLI